MQKAAVFGPYLIYLSVFAANLLSFSVGIQYFWSATILPKLNDTSVSPLPESPTTMETSWIVSITNLASIVGPFIGGLLAEKFGKKRTLLLVGVPVVIGYLIMAFATQVWMFLLARFLMGLSLGNIFSAQANYTGDVAEDKNRGLLGTFTAILVNSAAMFLYTVGPFISIRLFHLICLIPLALFYVIFGFFVPDTPYDLLRMNEPMEKVKRSLAFYRGKNETEVEDEIKKLQTTEGHEKVPILQVYKTVKENRALLKAVRIIVSFIALQAFGGMPAVSAYAQTIFDESGGAIKSIYSVMILGVVTIISTLVVSQLVERLGRRLLVLTGFTFTVLSLFALGTYFLIKSQGHNTDSISWLPLVSLIAYYLAFGLASGIPWILMIDMFSVDVLDTLSNLCSFVMFSTSFVVSLVYPFLKEAIGNYGSFYFFGTISVFSILFAYISIPETKGKSIREVHEILNK